MACRKNKAFEMQKLTSLAVSNWRQCRLQYLGLRLRVMASKIRDVSCNLKTREPIYRMISEQ